jgi:hypothetical protein
MTRTLGRRGVLAVVAAVVLVLGVAGAANAATPISLLVPQSTAFAVLGHSCGGIQEQAYATGFDATSGSPVGDVYMQTRCGGSGRGGGYQVTTYSAWVATTWDFGGSLVSYTRLSGAPSVDPAFSAYDAHGDEVYNSSGHAYLSVIPPAAPTGVTAVSSGGRYQVSWTPDPGAPITSSTVTATPEAPSTAPVATATVTGSAATALIGPLQPQTTYDITVVSTNGGGSSPASGPVTITTPASSTAPGAPTGVKARWTAPGSPSDTMVVTWLAPAAGDSPIDQYQITVNGSDGGGTFTQTVSGSTPTATFAVNDIPDWSIQVRAHNAAGWGPWSTRVTLGGT